MLLLTTSPLRAEPFVDEVRSYTIGTGGGAGESSLPGVVLGPPQGGGAFTGSLDTLSLGLGGTIDLAFTDNVVVNGPGPDFTVFENAFLITGLTTLPPYAEPGTVSVSADGAHWVTFGCAVEQAPYYPGCAGVYPVFATDAASALVPSTATIESLVNIPVGDFVPPAGSGGDSFDLADVGLHAIRFVRIDASQRDTRLGGLSGFDLDAVAALHSVDVAGAPDGDGDGIPDPADDCPTVADPEQRDADGDGVGDACPDVPPPDRDGDGVPDAVDVCPDDPDPAQADGDADGVGDACDPCPAQPSCGPVLPVVFAGEGRKNDELLGFVSPTAITTTLAAGTPAVNVVLVIASEVEPGSVRVRFGRRDVTATLGPFVPGSTITFTVPIAKRRTTVALRANRPRQGRRKQTDTDRLVFVTPSKTRSHR